MVGRDEIMKFMLKIRVKSEGLKDWGELWKRGFWLFVGMEIEV